MSTATYALRLTLEGAEIGRGRLTAEQYDVLWAAVERGECSADIVTPGVVFRLDAVKRADDPQA